MVTKTEKVDLKLKGLVVDSNGEIIDQDGNKIYLDDEIAKYFLDNPFDILISYSKKTNLEDAEDE